MSELLSKLFDIGKLPTKVVALACLVSLAILFSPDPLHEKLHTKHLVDSYGFIVGLVFISSAALIAINTIIWAFARVSQVRRIAKRKRDLNRYIAGLDPAEVSVLREFFIQNKQTLVLPVDEPTVAGLIANGLLCQVGKLGQGSGAGLLFPFQMAFELRDALTSDRLGLPHGKPTEADIGRITAERPAFMREVERVERMRSGL
jgi:hypothetical protein